MFLLLMLLKGFVLCLDAQNVFPSIGKCDSIEIDCINPSIMTFVDLHEEAFERYFDREKKMREGMSSFMTPLVLKK